MISPAVGAAATEGSGTFSGAGEIIVDDADPDALILLPTADAWRPSSEPRRSYANGSVVTRADGTKKSATFRVSIPADGVYDVQLFWVSSGSEFRSNAVPVFVHTSDGIKKVIIDQVSLGDQFQTLGKFPLNAGTNQPVVSISTAGVPAGTTTFISVDALKLVPAAE